MKIQNIVFDVGNVLVKWDPIAVISEVFPEEDPGILLKKIVKSDTWYHLNGGKITELEAIQQYHQSLNIPLQQFERFMTVVKESLLPMEGSFELVEKLYQANHPLYIITDNTREIESYLRQKYDFWSRFRGVVNSAHIGVLKPSPIIYRHLLETYQLIPEETIFFDDLQANVEGAIAVKMKAIQFETAAKCEADLRHLKVAF